MHYNLIFLLLFTLGSGLACGPGREPRVNGEGGHEPSRPSILLVTLDTTRADVVGYAGGAAVTPALDRLAGEGLRFDYAYATAPTTLPSHASMMTGFYPAGHGVHENGRSLDRSVPVLADRLVDLGYATAAFVSGYPLARQFGLARGFAEYDDRFAAEAAERRADATTEAAVEYLASRVGAEPVFLWVHYFDAHDPFDAPEPFAARYPQNAYAAEVAWVDHQMGRLVAAFRDHAGDGGAILVVGDHGEGLGDHGEERHGNLLYDGVMRVPLVVVVPGVKPRTVEEPVSVRRVFYTLLDLAGEPSADSLLGGAREIVLGEAMTPYLHYGWQPQVMAITRGEDGLEKVIRSGHAVELYLLEADPEEEHDLALNRRPSATVLERLRVYPTPDEVVPSSSAPPRVRALGTASERDVEQLAALGYLVSGAPPALHHDAPRARDMTDLFAALDRGAGLFARERWHEAIDVYEVIAERDPGNLMVQLRLAVSHSLAGDRRAAEAGFARAAAIAPDSVDRRRYEALHHCRFGDLPQAAVAFDSILGEIGDNVPALECLAEVRLHQGRLDEAAESLERVAQLRPNALAVHVELGRLRMARGETGPAIDSFEAAGALDPSALEPHLLELGVLYLAARRFEDARAALDRIAPDHPEHAMVLFKRAQVAVLLGESDAADRIARARRESTPETRSLIGQERLFADLGSR